MLAAKVGNQAFAMLPHATGFHIGKAWGLPGAIAEWTAADFHHGTSSPVDEAGFRQVVEEWAGHQRQLAGLGRRTISSSVSTPWGLSQHAVAYADGVIAHSTASHGGFALEPNRNAAVPSMLRSGDGFYEEDCAWAAVAIAFPDLFTDYEKRHADETLRQFYPEAWEAVRDTTLEPGQSRTKDRRQFDRDNADRWVVISAILSSHRPGFVECIATLGGRRSSAGGQGVAERRYLVCEEHYDIGAFGFVIDEHRDQRYGGPSSFIGWREP
ncbi:DUF7007 domain-containing protein [Rhizobium laguerreae]|uniref:DUF7007 domain-containing protein n=1 Tax=Rhizobium laguerreae TaxID=1076926 RepID=UPI001C8FF51E|nr:hypothetical protein [Rhizobium laguerreae]